MNVDAISERAVRVCSMICVDLRIINITYGSMALKLLASISLAGLDIEHAMFLQIARLDRLSKPPSLGQCRHSSRYLNH